jgi:hypothetical protein
MGFCAFPSSFRVQLLPILNIILIYCQAPFLSAPFPLANHSSMEKENFTAFSRLFSDSAYAITFSLKPNEFAFLFSFRLSLPSLF